MERMYRCMASIAATCLIAVAGCTMGMEVEELLNADPVVYSPDQTIYFNVLAGSSTAVLSFTTTAASFEIACPNDATMG